MTEREEKALRDLVNALLEWPCEPFIIKHDDGTTSQVPGGRHYQVDYTVARARKSYRAYEHALKVFPQLKPQE